MRIVCAGDQFIAPQLFVDALRSELGEGHEFVTIQSSWPYEPMHNESDVLEWVGDEEQLKELSREADVFVTHLAPVTGGVIGAAEHLRIIGCSRGGPVNVNVKVATRRGIPVVNTPGKNAPATAEFAIGLLLAGIRRIPQAATDLRQGHWAGELYAYGEAGSELCGRTVGVIGLGQVGARVARILVGFEARVLGFDPYVNVDFARKLGVELVDLSRLLAESDVITLHARLTAETRGVIGRDALSQMKRGSYLVNAARGGLLDYAALTDAVASGHLAGAALDVFDEEPPAPDSALLKLPQITTTPHIAGASRETAHRGAEQIAAEIGRFVRGEPLLACVNPDALRRGE